MTLKKLFIGLSVVLLIILTFGIKEAASTPSMQEQFPWQEKPPLPTAEPEWLQFREPIPAKRWSDVDEAVKQAFYQKVNGNRESVVGFLLYEPVVDHVVISEDGSIALLWIGLRDPETGAVIETEPGLSIARSQDADKAASPMNWSVDLPPDINWSKQSQELPADLMTDDLRIRMLAEAELTSAVSTQVFSGYKLPWAFGLEKRVTNSIGHYLPVSGGLASCPNTCQFAFDFADGTMFPLIAAKGGTVKAFKWTCANSDEKCTNYLILEDQSTIPTSYQIYYHMAYNSIPLRLRAVGAPVLQGEYIGDVDDTGFSTGHHLHYHVYTTRNTTDWSWGYSVDITFDDVTTNGGRPRTCSEASQYPDLGAECMPNNRYRSGNIPANPPTGSFTAPTNRAVINTPNVIVSGSAQDDNQVTRIQVLVNYDGVWREVDSIIPAGNGPYEKEVNLCKTGSQVPDGPFAMTVKIFDYEGGQASGIPIRHLIKNYSCDKPQSPAASVCAPGPNQVALYTDNDYRGTCKRFDVNNTTGYFGDALAPLADNSVSSIEVGSNAYAVLLDRSSDVPAAVPQGRMETFFSSDASLADNRIGDNRVSGLIVRSRAVAPSPVFFNSPFGNRAGAGTNPTSQDSLVLAWEGGAGAASFDVSLTGPNTNLSRYVTGNDISVGTLAAGNYTLTVTGKNSAGVSSKAINFTVDTASLPSAATRSVPYSENFDASAGDWVSTGLWRRGSVNYGGRGASNLFVFNNGQNYADANWKAGDLTSPPIAIPSSGTHYLRFIYYAGVEDGYRHWDQRLVQVSTNGGPFTDLHQLSDDKQEGQVWLNSGPISLAQFAGKTIRLRFHFDAIDEDYNSGIGWAIDDITINNTAPNTACADNNNSTATATTIALGSTINGVICPQGDLDFYKFNGQAGQAVVIDIDARTLIPASKLDSYIFLLDTDGASPIAENDDEKYQTAVDSLLPYTFTRTGTYYIKVKAWNHPGMGTPDHFYNVTVKSQPGSIQPKAVNISFPHDRRFVPHAPFEIRVKATDYDDGDVAAVEFFWHGPDWSKPEWVKLGKDTNGADGWSFIFDPLAYGEVKGSALYVQAIGKSGAALGRVMWDLEPDLTTPKTTMTALPATNRSTAMFLQWSAVDEMNDISHFEIQYQMNGGPWNAVPGAASFPGSNRSAWVVGAPGVNYGFRMRAFDLAGNVEAYPAQAAVTTTIESSCVPDPREYQGQSLINAIPLARSRLSETFNLCNTAGSGSGDVDWVSFTAQKGEKIYVIVASKGGGAAFKVNLKNTANAIVATGQSAAFGDSTVLRLVVPDNGTYFLEISPFHSALFGTDVTYQVLVENMQVEAFMPNIGR
jgi:murein DD-endopeptidase MepM/ murein hydrolase activator NlpD